MVMDWIDQGIARKLDKTCLCDQVMVVHWSGTLRAMFPLVPRWHRSAFLLTSPFLPGSKRIRIANLLYRNLSPSPASFMAFPPVFSLSPSCSQRELMNHHPFTLCLELAADPLLVLFSSFTLSALWQRIVPIPSGAVLSLQVQFTSAWTSGVFH